MSSPHYVQSRLGRRDSVHGGAALRYSARGARGCGTRGRAREGPNGPRGTRSLSRGGWAPSGRAASVAAVREQVLFGPSRARPAFRTRGRSAEQPMKQEGEYETGGGGGGGYGGGAGGGAERGDDFCAGGGAGGRRRGARVWGAPGGREDSPRPRP